MVSGYINRNPILLWDHASTLGLRIESVSWKKIAFNGIVTCLGTSDAVQIGNLFYYNITRHDYNYYTVTFLHNYMPISSLYP
jgi:hypothetical protein